MFEQINESIEVIVKFQDNQLKPVKFLWHDKEYLVQKVNLAWSSREGRTKFYYFAVSDGANYFKLRFDSENLSWMILESYSE